MTRLSRRELFRDVGRGMFAAALGPAVAADLGLGFADGGESDHLAFGELDPLVGFIQDTPPNKLLAKVMEKLNSGADLKQLVAAAALVNARAFGGHDYEGFHTLMALAPSYWMSQQETRPERKPLAVMKVLMRNSNRLYQVGGAKAEKLHPVKPGKLAADRPRSEQLRDSIRKGDMDGSEAVFAAICAEKSKPDDILDDLMVAVDDSAEVHRIVLVSRAWDMVNFVGAERAHTMLRQSVRFCVEARGTASRHKNMQELLPKVIDRFGLLGKKPGTRDADDAWVAKFADTIFRATPEQAMEATAEALGEGIAAEAVSQGIGLAANQLIIRENGRLKAEGGYKPVGSIHGDSIGVHACDSCHAWRHLAKFGDRRTQVSSLILAAYQVARDRGIRIAEPGRWEDAGSDLTRLEPYPRAEHREAVKGVPGDSLMKELDGAIRDKNQSRAAALTHRLVTEQPDQAKEVIALFRAYATSEDGALHAEKFFITATDEYASARPAHRVGQLIGLARVTASEYGNPAPGYKEACALTKG